MIRGGMARGLSTPSDWQEARRWQALVLKQQGWQQQRIAQALGVTKGAVSQWMATVREYGAAGLRARLRSGAPPRLNGSELHLVPELLAEGAEAYGFRGEVWTCARIGKLIEWVFGVTYHKAHVSRLLKRLAWTPQKPLARAAQRDEDQIAYWRTTVRAELKKRRVESGVPWYLWMKAASICCRRWYAPMRRVVRLRCCGLC
jgi:transposase